MTVAMKESNIFGLTSTKSSHVQNSEQPSFLAAEMAYFALS